MHLCKAHCSLLKCLSRFNFEIVISKPSCAVRRCVRNYSSNSRKKHLFITTPIFYVNAAPHIGHLYSCLLADAAARWSRLKGEEVIFSTGTDEHGLKVQQAAARNKQTPDVFASEVSSTFKEMFDCYNISYTDFIRTTEKRHKEAVYKIWNTLVDRGHIYKGSYEGWYSISDEAFLGADDVKDMRTQDGKIIKVSAESGQPVSWMKEDNYMFRLTDFADDLLKWLNSKAIVPNLFDKDVRKWVMSLRDLSISRQRERLQWGIPVPGDDTQTIYVWLDALVNYLTVSGYPSEKKAWPADFHIVGKDILKFHAVYWPAFLMAAGLDPPKKIFCHSHWLVDGVKMSKSRGNVVDPMLLKEKYSAEVFRYLLLREGVPHNDGNYNEITGLEYINADLVNTCGNLLSRCTAPSVNPEQTFPRKSQDAYYSRFNATERQTFEDLDMLVSTVEEHYEDLHFSRGIESIMSYFRWANVLVQDHEPWKLVKSENKDDIAHLKTVLHMALETLRVGGVLLQPIVPQFSRMLLDRLGIPQEKRTIEHARSAYLNSPQCLPLGANKGLLLKRIVIPEKKKAGEKL